MLRAVFFLFLFIPFTLFIILTGVPVTFLDPTGRFLHTYAKLWGRVGLILGGVKCELSGAGNIPAGTPVIFMGNHQGNFDILALFASLPGQFRWLAKKELFDIPLFGYAMARAGYISIDRSNPRQALKSIKGAAERIRNGASVVIFPEGTRTHDGALLPFKRGGFQLAAKAGAPIIPFAITGSMQVNPRNRLELHNGVIRIRFGAPISTEGADAGNPEGLMTTVRAAISELLQG